MSSGAILFAQLGFTRRQRLDVLDPEEQSIALDPESECGSGSRSRSRSRSCSDNVIDRPTPPPRKLHPRLDELQDSAFVRAICFQPRIVPSGNGGGPHLGSAFRGVFTKFTSRGRLDVGDDDCDNIIDASMPFFSMCIC